MIGRPWGNHDVGVPVVFSNHLTVDDLDSVGKDEVDPVVKILGIVRAGCVGPSVTTSLELIRVNRPERVGHACLHHP